VHELSQTSLYRELADEVIWEFEEGMEEALGGEQLLLAAIKLSLKGDAHEVFHMRKCTATLTLSLTRLARASGLCMHQTSRARGCALSDSVHTFHIFPHYSYYSHTGVIMTFGA